MHAQIVKLDGPRSRELVAASDRAGTERILPAVSADPEIRGGIVATFVMRQPSGAEVVIIVAETEEILERGNRIINETPLLSGEDPALLPGPDSVETYEVVRAFGPAFTPLAVRS
ncbi:MAG TPA: hypothetical protein VGJ59_11500 [Jatrophihabitantaceae bacterium]|jgi:hypothetical protein